jgi:hypothetical protein
VRNVIRSCVWAPCKIVLSNCVSIIHHTPTTKSTAPLIPLRGAQPLVVEFFLAMGATMGFGMSGVEMRGQDCNCGTGGAEERRTAYPSVEQLAIDCV